MQARRISGQRPDGLAIAVRIAITLGLFVTACSPSPSPPSTAMNSPVALVSPIASPSTPAPRTGPTPSPTATPPTSPSAANTSAGWRRATVGRNQCCVFGLQVGLGGFVVSGGLDRRERPLSWWSRDGAQWRRIAGLPGQIVRSDGTPRGGIAADCARPSSNGQFCVRFGLWHTTDGRHWRPATRIVGLTGLNIGDVLVSDAAGRHGRMIAIGVACPRQTASVANPTAELASLTAAHVRCPNQSVLMSSADGMTWRVLPVVPNATKVRWQYIMAGAAGFLVTGWVGEKRIVVSTSPDGRSWRPGITLPGLYPGFPPVLDVGTGFVVAGSAQDGSQLMFTSNDGAHWSEASVAPLASVRVLGMIATSDRRLVALGSVADPVAQQADGDPDNVHLMSQIWVADGGVWSIASTSPPSGEDPMAIATDGRRMIVLTLSANGRISSWTSLLP